MLSAFGSAGTESSSMSALYLTCRIWITCHKAGIFARTLQVSVPPTIRLVTAAAVRGYHAYARRRQRALAG